MPSSNSVPLTISLTSGQTLTIDAESNWTVNHLKWAIHRQMKFPPKEQRLFIDGIELEESDYLLENYGIDFDAPSTSTPVKYQLSLHIPFKGIPNTSYFLVDKDYDPKWNGSFMEIKEFLEHHRGGHPYYRPIGSVRYGIKVLGRYENDRWLGGKGFRTEDEWPVAYHGTKEVNVLDIVRQGLLLQKCVRFAYGKGIYCTPDPLVAIRYAHNYEYDSKQYKLILQCRVDPKQLKIVYKQEGTRFAYWLVPDGSAIRPYGICVYPSNDSAGKFAPFVPNSNSTLSNTTSMHSLRWSMTGTTQQGVTTPPPAKTPAVVAASGNAQKTTGSTGTTTSAASATTATGTNIRNWREKQQSQSRSASTSRPNSAESDDFLPDPHLGGTTSTTKNPSQPQQQSQP